MLIYPLIIPNYINIQTINYTGYKETFKTQVITRTPLMWRSTQQKFKFEYQNLCREHFELIRDFHLNLSKESNRVFLIPAQIFRFFEIFLKQRIFCKHTYWIFEENKLNISPNIINNQYQTYNVDFVVCSVLA